MNRIFISAAFGAALITSAVQAGPIDTIGALRMSHIWLINSGNVPAEITFAQLTSTLVNNSDAAKSTGDRAACQTGFSDFCGGNPFTDPSAPV